jgi:membrane-associated phospholipid phosphatase
MAVQYALTIAALTATSRFLRVQQYQAALTIALVVSICVFTLVPAVGTYAFLNVSPENYAALDPILTFKQMQHLEAMRNHSWSAIRELEGLISFPSFHTASGVLFVWALYPIRKLRWWIVALNVAMIASAPLQGAHYFIDIVAGVGVALAAVSAVSAVSLVRSGDYASGPAAVPAGVAEPAAAG